MAREASYLAEEFLVQVPRRLLWPSYQVRTRQKLYTCQVVLFLPSLAVWFRFHFTLDWVKVCVQSSDG